MTCDSSDKYFQGLIEECVSVSPSLASVTGLSDRKQFEWYLNTKETCYGVFFFTN